jgi:hypothetical protein
MNIQEVIRFLKNNYYVMELGGEIVLTNKLKREFKKPYTKEISTAVQAPQKPSSIAVNVPVPSDFKTLYKTFIKEAQVPTYLELSSGGRYSANRYSKDAEKVFVKIVKDPSINLKGLLIATKLYYKQKNLSRQTISNYFIQGTWESVYEDFMETVKDGNVEDYISKTLKEGNGENTHEEDI